MDLATCEALAGPAGRDALAAAAALAPTEAKYPACFDRLRKRFPPDLARAALDVVLLRPKGRVKFTRADDMLFTREALEVASGETVARYRAERFAPFATVADLCCGLGGDATGLALSGRRVIAVDRDPVRLRLAAANVAVYGVGSACRFQLADVLADPLPDADAAFADPGRRPAGRRKLSPDEYEPPVSAVLARFPAGHPVGVKVAPGIPRDDLRAFDADAEFTSVGGELKECTLWFGGLRSGVTRASVLPGPHVLTGPAGPPAEVAAFGEYILDPDPAVTRAGLVGVLADRLGAGQIDPDGAFLTTDAPTVTPFATTYRVEASMPFHARRLGEWLKARGVGRVTVVKRGSSVDADELVAKWKLRGDGHRAVILTRVAGEPVAVIGERVWANPERERRGMASPPH